MTKEETIDHLLWWALIRDVQRRAAELAAQDANEEEDAAA